MQTRVGFRFVVRTCNLQTRGGFRFKSNYLINRCSTLVNQLFNLFDFLVLDCSDSVFIITSQ